MLKSYLSHVAERKAQGIPPLPLDAKQTQALTELLEKPDKEIDQNFLLDLLINRIPPGVDQASYVKATWLSSIAQEESKSPLVSPLKATELLGTMIGGYNVAALIEILDSNNKELAASACDGLSNTLLVYDALNDIFELAKNNIYAEKVINSWSNGEWFTNKQPLAEKITVTVFKVEGETNTDDLSPATHATTRPDIPLHALAMLETRDPNGLSTIEELKKKGHDIAYVGDVVGTGSSRKSAINSVLWHTGQDIPFVPNKRGSGVVIGGKIAPIFFNTAEDSGALPIECDVSKLKTGDVITIFPYKGEVRRSKNETNAGELLSKFDLKPQTITANKNILPDTQSSASDFSNTTSATPQQNNSDTPIQNSVNSLVLQEKDRINSQNISDNIAHSNQIEQHNNEALIDKSESMQIKRKEMIDQFIFNGIFSKVAMPGSLPRVWVTYKFHGLTFEEKKTAIGVVYAYYFDGTDKVNGVRIFDSATNNEIGNYSITYPYLRLYK